MENSCLNFPEALQITELGLPAAGILSAPSEAPQRFPNIVILEHILNPTFLGRPLVFPWVKILVEFCLIFKSATAFMFHVVARAHRGDNEQNALLRNVSVDLDQFPQRCLGVRLGGIACKLPHYNLVSGGKEG